MFEAVGVIVVSLIALFGVICFVGLPWLGLGFGGPSAINWAWMIGGLVAAGLIVLSWWNLVGTKIHLGFG